MLNLIPAGEFQPSDDSRPALIHDLDLWFAMMREYAEEFLGIEEARVRRGAPIDYDHDEPFKRFQAARRRGEIRPYILGGGSKTQKKKAQIYTACIFEGPAFDRLFSGMVGENNEGVLELPTLHRVKREPLRGWAFDESTVRPYLAESRLGPSGRVTLGLSLKHRSALGI